MKTTLLLISIFITCISNAQLPYSKQNKFAVFDIDLMVQALPEYAVVDSLVKIYEQDTLGAEYQSIQNEYNRIDSLFRNYRDFERKTIDTSIIGRQQELAMNVLS